jgi:hypothetical protein
MLLTMGRDGLAIPPLGDVRSICYCTRVFDGTDSRVKLLHFHHITP